MIAQYLSCVPVWLFAAAALNFLLFSRANAGEMQKELSLRRKSSFWVQ